MRLHGRHDFSGGSSISTILQVPSPASAIGSNSTYQVSSDGRGSARLMITTTSSVAFEVDVDFVLTSSSHGLIIEFDAKWHGQRHTRPATQHGHAGCTGRHAVRILVLAGGDTGTNPLATVGAFTLDSTGNITAGVEDFNPWLDSDYSTGA